MRINYVWIQWTADLTSSYSWSTGSKLTVSWLSICFWLLCITSYPKNLDVRRWLQHPSQITESYSFPFQPLGQSYCKCICKTEEGSVCLQRECISLTVNCVWLSLWCNDLLGFGCQLGTDSWQVSRLQVPQSSKQFITIRQETELGQKIDTQILYLSFAVGIWLIQFSLFLF